jgi:hypothetical protein
MMITIGHHNKQGSEVGMMNQKEAVYQAITGMFDVAGEGAVELSRDQKHDVISVLIEGFKAKRISYAGELPDDKQLRNYCSGLLNNWLRKDTRLNGGTKYEAKNPGARRGSADPQVVALRKLQAMQTDPDKVAEIQVYIDKRIEEITPKVEIDVSALPADLRAKFGF